MPRRLRLGDWRISRHALQRALQRRVPPDDILAAIDRPHIRRPAHRPGHEYRQRGRVAVVIAPAARLIITVLVTRTDTPPSPAPGGSRHVRRHLQ